MQLVRDYVHISEALGDEPSDCRVRVYQEEGLPTVFICTELPGNQEKGASIVGIAECLAVEVWEREGKREPFIWIEHYPADLAPEGAETFHKVTFVRLPSSRRFWSPQWERMTKEEVEKLVGHKVE